MRRKLMYSMIVVLLFSLLAISVLFKLILNYQNTESLKHYLTNNNRMLINIIQHNNIENVPDFLNKSAKGQALRITYINRNGEVVYDSQVDPETMDNHNNREEVIDARNKGEGYSVRYSNTLKKDTLYYATDLGNGYIIRSSVPMDIVTNYGGNFFKPYIFVVIAVLLISIWFSSRFSYLLVKPIDELTSITNKVANGELHRRVNIITNDEIGQLGRTFNHMADKLQSTIREVLDEQNRLEAILKSMDSGVIAVDKSNKIIMINPYAEEIFGIKKNIIGQNLMDNIRDFEFERVFKGSNEEYKEIKILWPRERELRIKTADIISDIGIIGTVAVVQDITDIKRLENMRSQFVANVSHELKTPLTSIKGFAETLKFVEDAEKRKKFLDIINDEAERLTRLINDILTLSDIENRIDTKVSKLNVNMLVNNVYNLMKNTAEKKQINLTVKNESNPIIIGSEDRFKQMLINLVDNAIKYSERNDSVIIQTLIKDRQCIITIEDTGVGISEEHMSRLFERFYRVDKARSRSQGGTGLGLAIVKHILIGLGGNVKVESKLGEGSRFIVSLPLFEE